MAEWRSWSSRRVHIPKIVGSSPTFATMMNVCWGIVPNHQKPLQSVYLCADLSKMFFCSLLERGEMLREKKQANRMEVMSRSTSRSFPTLACLNILKGKREENKDGK